MSFTNLCLSLAALSPELSAALISNLAAAMPALSDDPGPQARGATLISAMGALGPRDLEEAILAQQFLIAWHGAEACFQAVAGLDPLSKEASRLRRDGMAMQRSLIALSKALNTSKAQPMLEDAATGEVRPTVPVATPKPPRPAATPQVAAASAQQAEVAEAAEPAVPAEPANDIFAGDPSLQRLRDRWKTLPRWETMTMEERRETFGYNYTPKNAARKEEGTAPKAS